MLKKLFKKVTALIAGATILAGAAFPAAASAESAYILRFNDVNERYEEAVSFLYELEIIKGKSPTEFGTYESLTRGDAAIILANALELDTENAPDAGFKDVNQREKGAVNALVDALIVSGYTKDTYEPKKPLSRGAMAKFLVSGFGFIGYGYGVETPFTDASGVFKPYIEALYVTNITNGTSATTYGTHDNIKRGDFANLLYKTMMTFGYQELVLYDSAQIIDSKTLSFSFEGAFLEDYPAQYIAQDINFQAELPDGSIITLLPENAVFSEDRKTITFNHEDLAGKKGILYVGHLELPFDYEVK